MTVTSIAVAITMFQFGMCDGMVDCDVGTGDFSLVLGTLHFHGNAHLSGQGLILLGSILFYLLARKGLETRKL